MGRHSPGRPAIPERESGHQVCAAARWWRRRRAWRLAAAAKSRCMRAQIHAAAESYMGLVEAGVGLIPAGGGTKEMLIRANEHAAGGEDLDLFHALKPVFENIAMAKVSHQRRRVPLAGLFAAADAVGHESRSAGGRRQGNRAGHGPRRLSSRPRPCEIRVLGEEFIAAAKLAIHHDAARRIYLRIRRSGRAQARAHPRRRAALGAADSLRAVRPRPRTRSLRSASAANAKRRSASRIH